MRRKIWTVRGLSQRVCVLPCVGPHIIVLSASADERLTFLIINITIIRGVSSPFSSFVYSLARCNRKFGPGIVGFCRMCGQFAFELIAVVWPEPNRKSVLDDCLRKGSRATSGPRICLLGHFWPVHTSYSIHTRTRTRTPC